MVSGLVSWVNAISSTNCLPIFSFLNLRLHLPMINVRGVELCEGLPLPVGSLWARPIAAEIAVRLPTNEKLRSCSSI